MGWTYGWAERRFLIEEILKSNLTWSNERSANKVLAHCCKGNNLWAVCETTRHKTPEGAAFDPPCVQRWVALYLLRRCGSPAEWGYKDMDESCGPCEVNCPLSYLELAPLVDVGYAKAWRERVREYWARQATGRALAKSLKAGDKFRTARGEWEFVRDYSRVYVVGTDSTGRSYRVRKADILTETPVAPVAAG
jgi:hypothetical protein